MYHTKRWTSLSIYALATWKVIHLYLMRLFYLYCVVPAYTLDVKATLWMFIKREYVGFLKHFNSIYMLGTQSTTLTQLFVYGNQYKYQWWIDYSLYCVTKCTQKPNKGNTSKLNTKHIHNACFTYRKLINEIHITFCNFF